MPIAPSRSLFLAVFVLLALSCFAIGQCPLQWQPGDPIPTVHGDVHATTVWDPDGAGPAPTVLVVGGQFGVGTQPSTTIASFDGATWASLGAPPMPDISAFTTWNGLLVAAGGAGAVFVIATWNGSSWSVVGAANGPVNSMVVFNGNLTVGGVFSAVNGTSAQNLAQWNGASWSEPGGGVTGIVDSLVVFSSLYVGGFLAQAGTVPVNNLAIWNGTAWTAGGNFNASVRTLAIRSGLTTASSFLFAGGDFTSVDGVPAQHVARFTVSTNAWTAIPGLPGASCRVLHVRSTSATSFQLNAAIESVNSNDKVWRLIGTTWTTLGATTSVTFAMLTSLSLFNGQYVAGLAVPQSSPVVSREAVSFHDGAAWQPVSGPGFGLEVLAVASLGTDLVVGGYFPQYGGVTYGSIARGVQGAWQPLGSGVDGMVYALCKLTNGDIVAGGDFLTAGGAPAAHIARWDGSSWSALGTGVSDIVFALLALPNGDLIAGGQFTVAGGGAAHRIARWNGTAWLPLGTGTDLLVAALARLSNGDLVATGQFSTAGGAVANRIARWNGANWAPLGIGLDGPGRALAVLPDDEVLVGGDFATAGGVFTPRVARWNGNTWLAQSTPTTAWDNGVQTLVVLPSGDYIAGGAGSSFGPGGGSGGIDANLARHRGAAGSSTWEALDLRGDVVAASTLLPNGDVVVGGSFDGAGGLGSHDVALLRPTCPATAVSYGSGCTGSGGVNVLSPTELPWVGGTFRAVATGMPTVAIGLLVTGLSPVTLPLPAVLPQGQNGCSVLVRPDLLGATLAVGGMVSSALAVPDTMSLAGQLLYHQVVPLELGPAGNIVAATGTNGLRLTLGVL